MNKKPVSCISIVCAIFVSTIPVLFGMVAIQLNRAQDYSWNSWRYIVLATILMMVLIRLLNINNKE
jgi:hypothetical protein